MIRIAIVDDEEDYLQTLEEYLLRFQIESGKRLEITRYRDGDEVVADFHCQFDLILMDIQMDFMDGMSAAEEIRRQDSRVALMFITNRTDYAIRGYAVEAMDYILKPISYFEFSRKLERALSRLERREQLTMSIVVSAGLKRVNAEEIRYIESEGHYLVFHMRSESFRSRARISDYERELIEHGFYRCNKGCLVNLSYVDSMEGGCAVVGGERLPVSRSRRQEFMTALAAYLGSTQG